MRLELAAVVGVDGLEVGDRGVVVRELRLLLRGPLLRLADGGF